MWVWFFADIGKPNGSGDPTRSGAPGAQRPRPQPKPVAENGGGTATAAAPGEEDLIDDESVGSEINDALRAMLPWMTSVLLHMSIILLTLFVVWTVVQEEKEERPIIPSAHLSDHPGGQLTGASDTDLANTQSTRQVETEAVANASADEVATLNNGSGGAGDALGVIGLSGGGGGGSSGKLLPFGTTTGTGNGLGAKFFGTGGNATRIIWIVDASGSLIDTLPFVIKELKRAVNDLNEKQQFTIIFFQNNSAIEVEPRGWKSASTDMRKRVSDFISLDAMKIIPHGATNPTAAIRQAMAYKPQLVFLLSDNITGKGKYEVDRDELLKLFNESNRDKKIVVNTIQFLYPDPLNTLADISKENGPGIHKFITEADLGLSH